MANSLTGEQLRKWSVWCHQTAEAFINAAHIAMQEMAPGRASWYMLASQIWDAIGRTPAMAEVFYKDIETLSEPADLSIVARASMLIAKNIGIKDHYYVSVLDQVARMWAQNFMPDLDFDTAAPQPSPAVAMGGAIRDQFDQAIADALARLHTQHATNCPCLGCQRAAQAFDTWAGDLGIDSP